MNICDRTVISEWQRYKKTLPKFALEAIVDASDIKFPEIPSTILTGATGLTLGAGGGLAVGLLTYSGMRIWRKYKENISSPY
jgi:hypothetical protein